MIDNMLILSFMALQADPDRPLTFDSNFFHLIQINDPIFDQTQKICFSKLNKHIHSLTHNTF